MSSAASIQTLNLFEGTSSIKEYVTSVADEILASLPDPARLTTEQRRAMIARYSSVLESNFIYWMTGALLSVKTEKARSKILENLHEEVRDCHPGMLRRFTLAAHALPTDADASAVYEDLANVRLFVGRLSTVPMLVMMAFFEGWIQRFMPYLAELAQRQGSTEMEYTDVHGVCDVTHTLELFNALAAEMLLDPPEAGANLFEGVDLLRKMILAIVQPVVN